MKTTLRAFGAFFCIHFVALTVSATIIVHEPFEYPVGTLANRNGGTGWTTNWISSGSSTVVNPGLIYDDLVYRLDSSSNACAFGTAGNFRDLPSMLGTNSETVYVSFIGRIDTSAYAGLSLFDGNTERYYIGRATDSGGALVWGCGRPNGQDAINSTVASATLSLVVVRLDYSGANVTIRLYVDPSLDAEPGSPIGQVSTSVLQFNRLRVQCGSTSGTRLIDEIRLGSTWDDVTPHTTSPSQLFVTSVSQPEGNSGNTAFVFGVRLSKTNELPVTVNFFTTNGTALAGSDFVATNGSLVFNPGETNKSVTVLVNGDTAVEYDETFSLVLSNAVNAPIYSAAGTGTIVDDDFVIPALFAVEEFAYGNGSAVGGLNGGMGWTNAWSGFGGVVVSPGLTYVDGVYVLAVASNACSLPDNFIQHARNILDIDRVKDGTIYVSFIGQVNSGSVVGLSLRENGTPRLAIGLNAGSANWSAAGSGLTLESDDSVFNQAFVVLRIDYSGSNMTVRLYVNPPLDAEPAVPVDYATTAVARFNQIALSTAGPPGTTPSAVFDEIRVASTWAAAVPLEGPPPPGILVNNTSVIEGDSGTTNLTFDVWLTHAYPATVTVDYTTVDGTATNGSDYTATSGPLIFLSGETNKTVSVSVLGDLVSEPDETLSLMLSNASNGTILDGSAIGTILDDDTQPVITVSGGRAFEGNAGTTEAVFLVHLSRAWKQTVSVSFGTSNITATAGVDYQSTNGTLNFAVGDTVKEVPVIVFGDTNAEPNEIMALLLSNPVNAVLGQTQRMGLIGDDDTTTHAGVPVWVAKAGDAVPGEPGRFFQEFVGAPVINEYNEVAFIAVTDTNPSSDPETGVWMGTEDYLFKVVGSKMPPPNFPDGLVFTGTFAALNLDDGGDLLFFAETVPAPGISPLRNSGGLSPKDSGEMTEQALMYDQFGSTEPGGATTQPSVVAAEGQGGIAFIRGARTSEAGLKPKWTQLDSFSSTVFQFQYVALTAVLDGDPPDRTSFIERTKTAGALAAIINVPEKLYDRVVLAPGDPVPGNPLLDVWSVDVLGGGGDLVLVKIEQAVAGTPAGEKLTLYSAGTDEFLPLIQTGDSFQAPGGGGVIVVSTILKAEMVRSYIDTETGKVVVQSEDGGTALLSFERRGSSSTYSVTVVHYTPPNQTLQPDLVVNDNQTAVAEDGVNGPKNLVIETTPDSPTAQSTAMLGIPGSALPAFSGVPVELASVQPNSVSLAEFAAVYLGDSSASEEIVVAHNRGDHSETALLVEGRNVGGVVPAYFCKESNEGGNGAGRAVNNAGNVGLFIGSASGGPPNNVIILPLIDGGISLFPPLVDFGDAPDGPDEPNYPTTSPRNGARHIVRQTGPRLGQLLDADDGLMNNSSATADDDDQFDDEDGVTFLTPILPGCTGMVAVVSTLPAKLDAWIDFNGDGDWDDPAEQIFQSVSVDTGTNILSFNAPNGPPSVFLRRPAYSRFRLSTAGNLNYFGLASDGEVEDYIAPVGMPLRIAKAVTPEQLEFSWQDACETYVLQYSDSLSPPDWHDLSSGTLSSGFWRYAIPVGVGGVYYRLRLGP